MTNYRQAERSSLARARKRMPRLTPLILCGTAAATVVIAPAKADVAPHLHLLAISSVPSDIFSARVVYYPTNNQFARNSVVSECFTGLQPGKTYQFPSTLIVADDNNNARQNSLGYNTTIQGFSDLNCQHKSNYAQILVRPNKTDYWWVSENVRWYAS